MTPLGKGATRLQRSLTPLAEPDPLLENGVTLLPTAGDPAWKRHDPPRIAYDPRVTTFPSKGRQLAPAGDRPKSMSLVGVTRATKFCSELDCPVDSKRTIELGKGYCVVE